MFGMADLDIDQLEEEVVSLRSEVDELRLELKHLSGLENRAKETRGLLELLLTKIEETLKPQVPNEDNLDQYTTSNEMLGMDDADGYREPNEMLGEDEYKEEEPEEVADEGILEETASAEIVQAEEPSDKENLLHSLAKDVAVIRDRLASDRAISAEFRMDFENFKGHLGANGCASVQQELEDIRKEIGALQSRLLRASLNKEV